MSVLNWLRKANPNLGKSFPSPAPGLPDPNTKSTLEEAEECSVVNSFIENQCEVLTPEGVSPSSRKHKRTADNHRYEDEERLEIAKYANTHGSSAAAKKFSSPSRKIDESTVRNWRTKFRKVLSQESATPQDITLKQMELSPRGAPPLLGRRLDQKVQAHVRSIRAAGGVINRKILIATATGIVSHQNRYVMCLT